jgi:hypothetical protein
MAAGKIQKQMVEIPHRAKIRIEGIWEHRTSNQVRFQKGEACFNSQQFVQLASNHFASVDFSFPFSGYKLLGGGRHP